MKLHSLDTETHLVQAGLAAPPLVCVSVADVTPNSERVYDAVDGLAVAIELFNQAARGELVIAGQTIDFDMGVLAAEHPELVFAIFAAVERGAVISADLIQKLHRIAIGTDDDKSVKNDLVSLEKQYLGIDRTQEKENGWRLRYHELSGVPLAQWPDDAVQYPRRDARGTLEVILRQLGHTGARVHDWQQMKDPNAEGLGGSEWDLECTLCHAIASDNHVAECPNGKPASAKNLHCVAQEMRACLFLRFGSIWGQRTDPVMVEKVVGEIREKHEESRRKFFEAGFVRLRPCNKKDGVYERADEITAETLDQLELVIPPGRAWSTRRLDDIAKCRAALAKAANKGTVRPLRYAEDQTVLKDAVTAAYKGDPPPTETGEVSMSRDTLEESGDPLLEEYGEAGANEKLYSTYVSVMEQGTQIPICFGFNSTLSTQRVSLYDPNLSQLPRKGGIRECFVPRGYIEVEE